MRSRDKLNSLYLHLQKPHKHQTRPGGDLLWQAPTLKVTRLFDQVKSAWSPDNLKKLILLAIKSDKVMT